MTAGIVVDVNADYGSLILGGLFAFGLSGCVNLQFIIFWIIYPGERWTTRFMVIATWFLDLCHSVFVAIAIWDSIISNYGDLDKIDIIPWSVGPTVELTAMVTFLVQSFLAYRIYRLHNCKLTVAAPVCILAFVRLVTASISMVEIISLKYYSEFVHPFPSWVFTLGLSLSAFVDIVITTSLCYFLRLKRSSLPSTNHTIDVLILWIIQNGSFTCLGTTATLICWVAMPQNRIFLGLHFVVPKLYANSLLATLNARNTIRESRKNLTSQAPPITMFPDGASAPEGDKTVCHRRPLRLGSFALQTVDLTRARSIEVRVHRTVEAKYDRDIDVRSVTAESAREVEDSGPVSETCASDGEACGKDRLNVV